MKTFKENDLINLIIAGIFFAAVISFGILIVKLALKAIYYMVDNIDWYNFGWTVVGYVGFILLIYGTYKFLGHDAERDRICELTDMERNKQMMETMEQDASYYVGHPAKKQPQKQKQCAESVEVI